MNFKLMSYWNLLWKSVPLKSPLLLLLYWSFIDPLLLIAPFLNTPLLILYWSLFAPSLIPYCSFVDPYCFCNCFFTYWFFLLHMNLFGLSMVWLDQIWLDLTQLGLHWDFFGTLHQIYIDFYWVFTDLISPFFLS